MGTVCDPHQLLDAGEPRIGPQRIEQGVEEILCAGTSEKMDPAPWLG